MLGSQGLHGPIIGNTNYKPALTFESGYHHTQSDYNMDLDADHGTTYSGSRIMFGTDVGNMRVNDYNMNVNTDNEITYSGSTMISDNYHENMTINVFGAPNTNFQQYFGEPNMSDPSNIIAASYESDIVGSDSNEKENCDAYFNLNNMINLFQNLGHPSANLPNEQCSEFNQVFYDYQELNSNSGYFLSTKRVENYNSTGQKCVVEVVQRVENSYSTQQGSKAWCWWYAKKLQVFELVPQVIARALSIKIHVDPRLNNSSDLSIVSISRATSINSLIISSAQKGVTSDYQWVDMMEEEEEHVAPYSKLNPEAPTFVPKDSGTCSLHPGR
ncbi:hypothetical protein HAX54_004964 [Datura stramonium]|uniref:Uncharacterized protein n=1 Tax=Datura stramonium TaxID=4076 RepID=A0ABS8T984_DATST|nr:hypothetical protein [Datura stramonium]